MLKMCEIFVTLGQIERQRLDIARYEAQKAKENDQKITTR